MSELRTTSKVANTRRLRICVTANSSCRSAIAGYSYLGILFGCRDYSDLGSYACTAIFRRSRISKPAATKQQLLYLASFERPADTKAAYHHVVTFTHVQSPWDTEQHGGIRYMRPLKSDLQRIRARLPVHHINIEES